MPVIDTKDGLEQYLANKKQTFDENLLVQEDTIIDAILPYFSSEEQINLQWLLLSHGLFIPNSWNHEAINTYMDRDFWRMTEECFTELQSEWNGPDVPIIPLPSDHTNMQLIEEFNGVSGLSFPDKVILFIGKNTSKDQLRALLTHEYSHAFRLHHLNRQPDSYTLKDTLVLEGVAEVAVRQRLGAEFLSKQIRDSSFEDAQILWKRWIEPNLHLSKNNPNHHSLVYGNDEVPKLTGYIVGYFLVDLQYVPEKTKLIELMKQPTESFFLKDI